MTQTQSIIMNPVGGQPFSLIVIQCSLLNPYIALGEPILLVDWENPLSSYGLIGYAYVDVGEIS